jgi:hypothetical protein
MFFDIMAWMTGIMTVCFLGIAVLWILHDMTNTRKRD